MAKSVYKVEEPSLQALNTSAGMAALDLVSPRKSRDFAPV